MEMYTQQYNGWSNYATWKINLEILGDIEFDTIVSVDQLKEIVEDVVFSNYKSRGESYLVEDYAKAFIDQVDFYEIAEAINREVLLQREGIAN